MEIPSRPKLNRCLEGYEYSYTDKTYEREMLENKDKDFVNQFGYGRKSENKIKKKLVNGEILKIVRTPEPKVYLMS